MVADGVLFWCLVSDPRPSPPARVSFELRALRRLQREQEPKSPYVFTSERGAPFTTAGFARMIERAGSEAKLGFKAHPHIEARCYPLGEWQCGRRVEKKTLSSGNGNVVTPCYITHALHASLPAALDHRGAQQCALHVGAYAQAWAMAEGLAEARYFLRRGQYASFHNSAFCSI
jgi:hypothetical protein